MQYGVGQTERIHGIAGFHLKTEAAVKAQSLRILLVDIHPACAEGQRLPHECRTDAPAAGLRRYEEHLYAVALHAEKGAWSTIFFRIEEKGDFLQALFNEGAQIFYIVLFQKVMRGEDGTFPDGEEAFHKVRPSFFFFGLRYLHSRFA